MEHDKQNFLSFWAIFCYFCPNSPKNKKIKKRQKPLEISSFYTFVPKIIVDNVDNCCKWNYNPLNLKLLFLQYQSNQNTLEYLIKGGVGINERPRLENSSKFNKQGCVAINF